jgi:hypothetical protein
MVLPQSRSVPESEIDLLVINAEKGRENTPFRMRHYSINYVEGAQSDVRSTSTTERQSKNRSHTTAEQRYNDKVIKTETIWIGDLKWVRTDDGEWKHIDLSKTVEAATGYGGGSSRGSGSGSGSGSASTTSKPEIHMECEYVGRDSVNGVSADIYKKTKRVTFVRPEGKIIRIITNTFWFDTQERLIKSIMEDKFKGAKKYYGIITEYEYDRSIKVEPPSN